MKTTTQRGRATISALAGFTMVASMAAAPAVALAGEPATDEPVAAGGTEAATNGTQQTFPLGYVVGRHAVLSYEINDEDLSASVGGSNQLWMTKTPANYFVRDVVEIVVSTEDVAPATPGAADEHPNSPNAGVLAGTQG